MNSETKPFANRNDAGTRLANLLLNQNDNPEIILALPRGGIPVALPISEKLGIPVQVLIVKKIGHPINSEYAIGALCEFGELWSNNNITSSINKEFAKREAQQKIESLKKIFPERVQVHDIKSKHVLVVDDGAATGLTIQLAITTLKSLGAQKISIAIPVCPIHTYQRLNKIVDRMHVLLTPQSFTGVGAYYEEFPQLTDEEAVELLHTT
ncbi:MAG: hypothetical protein RL131_113 [Bacteroidota bacterium]